MNGPQGTFNVWLGRIFAILLLSALIGAVIACTIWLWRTLL